MWVRATILRWLGRVPNFSDSLDYGAEFHWLFGIAVRFLAGRKYHFLGRSPDGCRRVMMRTCRCRSTLPGSKSRSPMAPSDGSRIRRRSRSAAARRRGGGSSTTGPMPASGRGGGRLSLSGPPGSPGGGSTRAAEPVNRVLPRCSAPISGNGPGPRVGVRDSGRRPGRVGVFRVGRSAVRLRRRPGSGAATADRRRADASGSERQARPHPV